MLKRLALILLMSCTALPPAGADETRAGAAKRSIVPTFPSPMGGFADRVQTHSGILDEIWVKALAVDDGRNRVMLITSDLIAVSRELTEQVRRNLRAGTGIESEAILVSASHNHSGPSGFQLVSHYGGEHRPELLRFLVDQFTEAGREAFESMRPAAIGYGSGRLMKASRNRQQNNEMSIDPEVGVIRVEDHDTRDLIAAVVNFTAHPVILGSGNLRISGEYPGWIQRTLEDVLGGIVLFTQGACGDVTIQREGDPHREIRRVGRMIAGEALRVLEQIRPTGGRSVGAAMEEVRLPLRTLPSPDEAFRIVTEAQSAVEAAEKGEANPRRIAELRRVRDAARTTASLARAAERHPDLLGGAERGSAQVLRIGQTLLAAIPGELFVEYGLEMKSRAMQDHGLPLMVVGYANDYIGYIITPRAGFTGGYEQSVARVDHAAGRLLVESVLRLTRRLAPLH